MLNKTNNTMEQFKISPDQRFKERVSIFSKLAEQKTKVQVTSIGDSDLWKNSEEDIVNSVGVFVEDKDMPGLFIFKADESVMIGVGASVSEQKEFTFAEATFRKAEVEVEDE